MEGHKELLGSLENQIEGKLEEAEGCVSANLFRSTEIAEWAAAMAIAQAEIKSAEKDSENPHFRSKYADLASIIDAIRGPFGKHGLFFTQNPSSHGSLVTVQTTIWHKSGQYVEGFLTLACRDSGPQSIGSGITYARRYSLQSLVGVAAEVDDDGNEAQGHVRATPQTRDNPNTTLPEFARPLESRIRQMGVKTRTAADGMIKMISGGKYDSLQKVVAAGAVAAVEVYDALEAARQTDGDKALVSKALKEAGLV